MNKLFAFFIIIILLIGVGFYITLVSAQEHDEALSDEESTEHIEDTSSVQEQEDDEAFTDDESTEDVEDISSVQEQEDDEVLSDEESTEDVDVEDTSVSAQEDDEALSDDDGEVFSDDESTEDFEDTSSAQGQFEITFPIPELGNCADEEECRVYCDDLSHKDECLAFARKHGLLDEEDLENAEDIPEVGPGGCASESECEEYCEVPGNFEECVSFAESHGLMTQEQLAQARADNNRTGPGGCVGREECEVFCNNPENHGVCVEFAHDEDLISDEEYRLAKEVEDKGGPGGCKSHEECRAFCGTQDHLEECLEFAKKEGHISDNEAKRILKAGIVTGPGGCQGKEECKAYCNDPSRQLECLDFAEKHELIDPKELQIARKMIGKAGPGGCNGPAECSQFCDNPDNTEVCLEFAADEGLMPQEEIERARKFLKVAQEGGPGGCKGRACADYCDNPANRSQCFEFARDQGLVNEEEAQQMEAGLRIQKVMEEKGGPGGCKTEDECRIYCTDPSRTEECIAFGATHSGLSEEKMRELLQSFTEQKFEARGFGPGGHGGGNFENFEAESFKKFEEFRQLEEQFRGFGGPGAGSFGPQGFPGGAPGDFPGQGAFPGAPGEFPGGPGGASGFGGFAGPGGCTSPAECIKYCTEHREECFGGGRGGSENLPGGPGGGFPGGPGGFPGGHRGIPQLRPDLLRPVTAPPGFQTGDEPAQSPDSSSSGSRSSITFNKADSTDNRYIFLFNSSGGIKEFLLLPSVGSHYGGGLGDCPRRHEQETAFPKSAFPIKASLIVCGSEETYETELRLSDEASSGQTPSQIPVGIPPEFLPPGGIPQGGIPPEFLPPGGFPPGGIPPEFLPPGGIPQFPSGFEHPPGFEIPQIPGIVAPVPQSIGTGGDSNVYLNPLPQYGADKYSIVVEDLDGVKEFGVQGAGGQGLYSGGYNTAQPCNASSNLSRPSDTVTIPQAYFPLQASVTDCNGNTRQLLVQPPPVQAGQGAGFIRIFATLIQGLLNFSR